MTQDFSKRITICVRQDLPSWQALNTIAHISAYFGNYLSNSFGTAKNFTTHDGFVLPRNSQYGIVVLVAERDDLVQLAAAGQEASLAWMGFIREMIDMIDDGEIQAKLATMNQLDIEYLGVGLFGDKDVLKKLTSHLKLWKSFLTELVGPAGSPELRHDNTG